MSTTKHTPQQFHTTVSAYNETLGEWVDLAKFWLASDALDYVAAIGSSPWRERSRRRYYRVATDDGLIACYPLGNPEQEA